MAWSARLWNRRAKVSITAAIIALWISCITAADMHAARVMLTSHQQRHLLPPLLERYTCFNRILEITCGDHVGLPFTSGPGGSGTGGSGGGEMLVFETARYGRNDTTGAVRCQVPYARTCDLDVQHPLSRACGGRRRCSLAVNTAFFGDPCGYDEFLKVTYRCVPVDSVDGRCAAPAAIDGHYHQSSATSGPTSSPLSSAPLRIFDRGFLSSPNYPGKYYTDADCRWQLYVQPTQTVRLTILDFELDVRRGGQCHDFVRFSYRRRRSLRSLATVTSFGPLLQVGRRPPTSGSVPLRMTASTSTAQVNTTASRQAGGGVGVGEEVEVFFDCGSLGKMVVDVPADNVQVWFKTGQSGLTQRGFIVFYEAVGPGCPLLNDQYDPVRQVVTYVINYGDGDDSNGLPDGIGVLCAETMCQPHFRFEGSSQWLPRQRRRICCFGTIWNETLPQCQDIEDQPSTTTTLFPYTAVTSTRTMTAFLTISEQPATLLGLVFGVVTVVLLAIVFVLLAIYCSRKQYAAGVRQRKQWRVVAGNLRDVIGNDNARNDNVRRYHATTGVSSTTFTDVIEEDEFDEDDAVVGTENCDECYRDATYRSMVKRSAPLTFRGGTVSALNDGNAGTRRSTIRRPVDYNNTGSRDVDCWQEQNLLEWPPTTSNAEMEPSDDIDESLNRERSNMSSYRPSSSTTSSPPTRRLAFIGENSSAVSGAEVGGCQYCEMVATNAVHSDCNGGDDVRIFRTSGADNLPVVVAIAPSCGTKTRPDVVPGLTAPRVHISSGTAPVLINSESALLPMSDTNCCSNDGQLPLMVTTSGEREVNS